MVPLSLLAGAVTAVRCRQMSRLQSPSLPAASLDIWTGGKVSSAKTVTNRRRALYVAVVPARPQADERLPAERRRHQRKPAYVPRPALPDRQGTPMLRPRRRGLASVNAEVRDGIVPAAGSLAK